MIMLVVLVFGVLLAPLLNRGRQQRAIIELIESHGGHIEYNYDQVYGQITGEVPWAPDWLRALAGEAHFHKIRRVNFAMQHQAVVGPQQYSVEKVPLEVLPFLPDVNTLQFVGLRGEQATDQGIGCLKQCGSLEELYVWDASLINNDSAVLLKQIPNLKSLCLEKSNLTDEGLRQISHSAKLERLVIIDNNFSDDALTELKHLTKLRVLRLTSSQAVLARIGDDGLKHIAELKELESLELNDCQATEKGFKYLASLPKLRVLEIKGCYNIDKIAALLAQFPSLKSVSISGFNNLEKAKVDFRGKNPSVVVPPGRRQPSRQSGVCKGFPMTSFTDLAR
jgi:hypothetical protein